MERTMLLRVACRLVVLACSFPAAANETGLDADIADAEFVISYDVEPRQKSWLDSLFAAFSSQKHTEMKVWVNLPQTIPGKQEVVNISFQPEPSRHFKENGNYYVEYQFAVPNETVHLEIIVQARIIRSDLVTIIKSGLSTVVADPNLDPYLAHERMIEKDDPLVRELASKINGVDTLDTVREIYHFVPTYLTVDLTKDKGVGAAKTAKTKKGMCIDYCDLFVALCRAKGIPARVVAGFKCHFSASPKHSWVEVYVEPYGWIPLDPTMLPNLPRAAVDHRFYNRRPHFLRFTDSRNDKVLHNSYFYCFPFWDKELMKKVSVFESMEFIKPKRLTYTSRKSHEMAKKTQKVVDEYIKQQKSKPGFPKQIRAEK